MALNINGRMKVKTLRADFKDEFGLTLRVYDGRSFADDDATLASIRKGDSKGGEFAPRKNTKVGNLEEKMMELFGIKVQISGSDDSYLCDNDLTLTGALEEDEKKMGRKEKKAESNDDNSKVSEAIDIDEPEELTDEEKKWLDNLWELEGAPANILSSRRFMLEAVKSRGMALRHASSEFKNDREIVREAVKSDSGSALQYASKELRNDEEFINVSHGEYNDLEKYNIYIVSYPSGEYWIGNISKDEISELKSYCDGEGGFEESVFFIDPAEYEYRSLGHVFGVALYKDNFEGAIFVEDNQNMLNNPQLNEGFYIMGSTPSEVSTHFNINISEEDFDISKLTIKYQTVDLPREDSGGKVSLDIITGINYDGEDYTDDMMGSINFGGYRYEWSIFESDGEGKLIRLVEYDKDGLSCLGDSEEMRMDIEDDKEKKSETIREDDISPDKENIDSEMSMKEIIAKIKEVYAGHDDLEEMVSDLSDNAYIDHWAEQMTNIDFPANIALAKELYRIAVKACESSGELYEIAEAIASSDGLNDKEWSRELYKSAIEKADNAWEVISIADSIADDDNLADKEWSRELYKKAEENISNLGEYNNLINGIFSNLNDQEWITKLVKSATEKLRNSTFLRYGSEVLEFGSIVAENKDKEKAKEIFDMHKESENVSDLLDVAREVMEIYDDDYSTEYAQEILETAIRNVGESWYCSIYNFIKEDLKDSNRAEEFKDEFYSELEEDYEEYELCEELFAEDKIDFDDIDFDDYQEHRSIIGVEAGNIVYGPIEDNGLLDKANESGFSAEAYSLAVELNDEFIGILKNKLPNLIEDKILMETEGKFQEYKSSFKETEDLEDINFYFVIKRKIPGKVLDALFLEMDEYGFYAIFENDDGDIVIQDYEYGEYDSGYFSEWANETHINNYEYKFKHYLEARKILLEKK